MGDNTRLVGLKKGDTNKNDALYKELFVDDSGYRLISSSPKVFSAIHPEDFGEDFYISEKELEAYVDGFILAISDNIDGVISSITGENNSDELIEDSALNDNDIKLSLYRSFKSLYDKWIASSEYGDQQASNYFYNTYSKDKKDDRLLYEHFNFVNRCGTDIGKKAVIDFAYLSNLASTQNGQGPTQSLYESITGLLSKNNFIFLPLPSYIKYSDEKDEILTDMFRAFDGPLTRMDADPKFVCMFIGGSSRTLDIPRSYCGANGTSFEHKDDSFDINDPTTYPEDFVNAGVTAFKVRYGQETQNHFTRIELDQAEFKETQDSLMVIDALVNPSSGSDPTQIGKGNGLYDVNLTRSYKCTVETMGNMQIQPTMFFKLENVPMFRGTYLITDVTHSIVPHNVKTTITAVRQPIVTVPIVTEALSILNLSLVEIVQTDGGGNTNNANPSQTTVNEEFDNNVNVSEYKNIADFDLFVYLSWQQGEGGAAQHYSLWKGNGKYKKYNIAAENIKNNWPGGSVSATGVKSSDVENLYKTDQKKLAEAFIDVQRQLYNSKKISALNTLNSNGENRTKIKYSEIKRIFQQKAKPEEGLTYESLAAFGNIENGLQTDTKDTATFKGIFQVNKTTFSNVLDNLSPKLGHKGGFTDWVPLDLYVELCVPKILKKFKSFASLSGFSS